MSATISSRRAVHSIRPLFVSSCSSRHHLQSVTVFRFVEYNFNWQHINNDQQTHRTMAGHSKWSNIRHKKKANDVARAKEHNRVARAIEVASRGCKGDMSDIHLQSTISAARAVQLPKERMERAISRGANPNNQQKTDGEDYVVRRYDGVIPTTVGGNNSSSSGGGKVAVIIETLTENRNRTAANVRHIITKAGGELLPTGANDWLFENVGLIWISKFMRCDNSIVGSDGVEKASSIDADDVDMDALLECALDIGATDVDFDIELLEHGGDEEHEGLVDHCAVVKCMPSDLIHDVKALQKSGCYWSSMHHPVYYFVHFLSILLKQNWTLHMSTIIQ